MCIWESGKKITDYNHLLLLLIIFLSYYAKKKKGGVGICGSNLFIMIREIIITLPVVHCFISNYLKKRQIMITKTFHQGLDSENLHITENNSLFFRTKSFNFWTLEKLQGDFTFAYKTSFMVDAL